MSKVEELCIGDVISFCEDGCKLLLATCIEEYVVEEVDSKGSGFVSARKLDVSGRFSSENPTVEFHLCPGYTNSLSSVNLVRYMTRIFV